MSYTAEQNVAQEPAAEARRKENLLVVLVLGTLFGILLVKSEVISWFRIQEMFRFQSIHMYGILGSGVVVAGISFALLKRFGSVVGRSQASCST